jgi:hypothetical protein
MKVCVMCLPRVCGWMGGEARTVQRWRRVSFSTYLAVQRIQWLYGIEVYDNIHSPHTQVYIPGQRDLGQGTQIYSQ